MATPKPRKPRKPPKVAPTSADLSSFRDELAYAGDRVHLAARIGQLRDRLATLGLSDDEWSLIEVGRAAKKNFAERLSRAIAQKTADALRPDFEDIYPDELGRRHESRTKGAGGLKKLDVNYSTKQSGLELAISVKTINFRDEQTNRYTKNVKRVDGELRAEAGDCLCTAVTLASTVVYRTERRRGAGHGRQWCPAECKLRPRWRFIQSTDDDRRARLFRRARSSCRREPGAPTSRQLVPAGRTDEWS